MRLAIILLFALVDVLLAFFNHFPLGALMLRFKDSSRLPGLDSQMSLIEAESIASTGGVYLTPVRLRDFGTTIFRLRVI